MKQYTVEPAYEGNDKVNIFENGEYKYCEIMSYWETEGYCNRLESEGYVKAYNLEDYKKAMDEAKEAYENACELYYMAKRSPLNLDKKNSRNNYYREGCATKYTF